MDLKRQYRLSIKELHSLYEHNYGALMKLTHQLRERGDAQVYLVGEQARYRLRLEEDFKYTSTVLLEQLGSMATFLRPQLSIRLYHDARMAEVCASQHFSRLKPRYDYPNAKMLLPNEKVQVNRFLSDWLKMILSQGRIEVCLPE
ncbi:DUF1249 domain-containing protein [Gallaecimonas sp. GXIMD4217]|uniref:DUF1249 domain-containing protein n=1 Tax=Gallaecimonas sp. GXIMD4217 TaxID=3131927 RepID=UPI00311AE07B